MGKGTGSETEVVAQEVNVISTVNTATAPVSSTTGDNKLQRQVQQSENRATQFGNDPDALFRSLGKQRTRRVKTDGLRDGDTQVTTEFSLGRKGRELFAKAKADFEARAGSNASAESISRGSGGGSFQTVGDFGGGGIQIGGVKPLGG